MIRTVIVCDVCGESVESATTEEDRTVMIGGNIWEFKGNIPWEHGCGNIRFVNTFYNHPNADAYTRADTLWRFDGQICKGCGRVIVDAMRAAADAEVAEIRRMARAVEAVEEGNEG